MAKILFFDLIISLALAFNIIAFTYSVYMDTESTKKIYEYITNLALPILLLIERNCAVMVCFFWWICGVFKFLAHCKCSRRKKKESADTDERVSIRNNTLRQERDNSLKLDDQGLEKNYTK